VGLVSPKKSSWPEWRFSIFSGGKIEHPPAFHQATLPTQENNSHKWWVLIAVGIGTFMSALDGSVVNTILPVLRDAFSSSIANIEWVVTVYLLVLSGLLLSFGRLGDLRGHKNVYLLGFFIFIASSALCGLAPSVTVLVICRAIQALGGAMLSANSPAILTKSFPARQRGQALGLQATMTYLGLTVGPSLGGWLADQFSWRAVFYINVPVGIVAIILSMHFIHHDQHSDHREPFDFAGAALFLTGLTALLFGLNQGQELGWISAPILASIFFAIVILVAFWWVETRISSPMLDFKLFSDRLFTLSVTSAIFNYMCVYSITFLMPFYLIQGLEMSPSRAGLILTAMPIIMAIMAPISGGLSDRFGTRLLAIIGMVVLVIGLFLLSHLKPDSPPFDIALRLAVSGFGIGVFISPNTSALMGAAPRERQGIASGVLATSRNMGMVLGVGYAGAIFTTKLGLLGNQSASSFVQATQVSFLAAAFIALLGIIVTALRTQAIPHTNQLR
jgi:EmrB/QacA subfamily drug resistance transporter